MKDLYTQLQWLQPAPRDFTIRLGQAVSRETECGPQLQRLAAMALDVSQLASLAKAIEQVRLRGESLHPLIPFRLAVLSNGLIDLILPALIASSARHGILLEVIRSPFDQVVQEAIQADSHLHQSGADALLLAIDYRALPLRPCPGNRAKAAEQLDAALRYIRSICEGVRSHSGALCILPTYAAPVEQLFGSLDRSVQGTMTWLIDSLNREVVAYAAASGNALLDVQSMAQTVGCAEWLDSRLWNLARIPFAEQFLPLYADHVARVLAAVLGKTRKVLILDLDNTLWGGVVGDDGPAGLRLAQGDALGEAFRTFQRMVLELRGRGVVLAVCSKNTDEIARGVFQNHPDMLLRLEHFAAFHANWEDKATNVKAIAAKLCVGLDSVVFVDDNPAERELVRQLLPEVAVPELSTDPAFFARTLAAAGYFETVTLSPEDISRADFYQDNAKRQLWRGNSENLDEYLESLEMTLSCEPFSASSLMRVVQLINKTNQYNLTTRRYTLPELIAAEADPGVFTLQARLSDRFGDNGIISVVICRSTDPGEWDIDTWLMSCRVLGRRVEFEVLRHLLECARAEGVHTLRGSYRPSGRNVLVSDHYARMGFTKIGEGPDGVTRWEIGVENAAVANTSIRLISSGFPAPHRHAAVGDDIVMTAQASLSPG